jgi:AAA+ ATPase superfamily predicted ATPase
MAFTLYPVTGEDFVGRKPLLEELTNELSSKNKIGYSLSGIRRVGKTSILREVKLKLEEKGIPTIYLSSWRILPKTIDEFTKVLTRTALAEFHNRLPVSFRFEELLDTGVKALARILSSLKLSAKVVSDLEVSISYIRRESDDVEAAITTSFALIEHLAEMTKSRCVLMLDEFPSLVDLAYGSKNQKIGEGMIQLLRTLVEEFRYTKLVVSGSFRTTLNNLVAKQKAPFYKQLLLREVLPFDEKEFDEFLSHYLPSVRFKDDETRKGLYAVSSGIPYNLHLLGKEIQLEELKVIDEPELQRLVIKVLKTEGELSFKEYVDGLQPSEIKVLRALATVPEAKPVEIAEREYMEDDTVNRALTVLNNRALIRRKSRAQYVFTDNLFAAWLHTTEVF